MGKACGVGVESPLIRTSILTRPRQPIIRTYTILRQNNQSFAYLSYATRSFPKIRGSTGRAQWQAGGRTSSRSTTVFKQWCQSWQDRLESRHTVRIVG